MASRLAVVKPIRGKPYNIPMDEAKAGEQAGTLYRPNPKSAARVYYEKPLPEEKGTASEKTYQTRMMQAEEVEQTPEPPKRRGRPPKQKQEISEDA